ncbi:LPXTG cell wall anchor domain-containing protein [Nonomuraea sp. NPDC059023]|uniref:LPXTG cell wall anchor domain-containing protein n=1 Tax=unclassified Nonomuraea TaxID=2593643 RepID=UPI0036B31BB2
MTHSLRRAGAATAALIAGLLAVFALSPAAHAAAPPDAQTVLSHWKDKKDPLYVENGSALTSDQQSEIRSALKDSKSDIYVAALPDGSVTDVKTYLTTLGNATAAAKNNARVTVAVLDGKTLFAGSNFGSGRTGQIANLSTRNNSDIAAGMNEFVNRINLLAEGKSKSALSSGSPSSGGSGTGALIGLGAIALVGGGGYFLYSKNKKKKLAEKQAKELAMVKTTVDEDVTKFGEEITSLDTDVTLAGEGGQHIDEWQHALDSYEKAKTQLATIERSDQIREVTQTLEDGRYSLAVVKAKVNNQPVPERRAPCFFNPQHGPSVRDVSWAPPNGAVREVPACAQDAEAVERGFDPQMREVMVDGQRRPYYDAGPAYQPYAYGYYGGFGDIMTGMFIGTMMGSMMGGWGMGGYGAGYSDAGAGGDFGGGGSDFGGGDSGGGWGDFGGGDFGGGDW